MTVEELQAIIAAQAVEIQRQAEMIQTLSESHDQNRRELQASTQKARDFTDEMGQYVTQASILHAELVAKARTAGIIG